MEVQSNMAGEGSLALTYLYTASSTVIFSKQLRGFKAVVQTFKTKYTKTTDDYRLLKIRSQQYKYLS